MALVPAGEGCLELGRLAASVHCLDDDPVLCKKCVMLQICCKWASQSRLVSLRVGGVRVYVDPGKSLSLSFVSFLGSDETFLAAKKQL